MHPGVSSLASLKGAGEIVRYDTTSRLGLRDEAGYALGVLAVRSVLSGDTRPG